MGIYNGIFGYNGWEFGFRLFAPMYQASFCFSESFTPIYQAFYLFFFFSFIVLCDFFHDDITVNILDQLVYIIVSLVILIVRFSGYKQNMQRFN